MNAKSHHAYDPLILGYLVVVHGLAVAAFALPWRPVYVVVAVGLYLAMGLGTTVGLHRLICHRSFGCPRWVEYGLISAAMVTGQGSPLLWAATHRLHHARSDRDGDPHSPRNSFWYGHMGWIYDSASTGRDDWRRWCRDLHHDQYYQWLLRYRLAPHVVVAAAIVVTLGWQALPACLYLPMVAWMNATYLVNSAGHWPRFGHAPFATGEGSRNVWWVGLLALGEGWHNNHHAFPASARHGLLARQFDLSWLFIRALMAMGLAQRVKLPDAQQVRARRRDLPQGT